jgi:hypothetical protein
LLIGAVVAAAATVAVGPVGAASAAAPSLSITSPPSGGVSNDRTPVVRGTTNDPFDALTETFDPVTLKIYVGTTVNEAQVQELRLLEFPDDTWAIPAGPLEPGTYTALAKQTNLAGETGESQPVTFTIDTTPPNVAIGSPANGSSIIGSSQLVSGSAENSQGDLPAVTIQLFAGSAIGSQPLEAVEIPTTGTTWSYTFPGLSAGTYTVRAEQADEAGNTGLSAPVTFSLRNPPPPPQPQPPRASFTWFPPSPTVGETVALVSSSTDASSPITAFAWALAGNGPFRAGKPLITTSFSAPGAHVVRLRVSDANGLSSVVSETIRVARAPLTLMQPFPIVRIAGSETSGGVRLTTLTVQAPPGARVTVSCQGRGCPARSESRVAVSRVRNRVAGTVLISFRRFEHALRAKVILRIRVSKPGEIGKYTRFIVRRGQLPERLDTCLDPGGFKPMACPSS